MSTLVRKPKAELLEEKFYAALRDVFVGAKVEGESGYINLMRIKSRYFSEGVFPKLKETIAAELAAFPDFRGELFDKLYTFFHRYFSESGSIYFRHTPLHQNVYERVYTNERDVMLFWKTHMLYYVKTDRLFRSLTVEPGEEGGLRFFFDAATLQNKKNNEKRELIYEFKERRDGDGTLVFAVGYSEKGRKTKTEEIVKRIKKDTKLKATAEELERAFRLFERQSEVDYFINRDARQFLEEQFRLWLYQYVFRGENVWTERRIGELQTLQRVALKIIDFIAQFENELVKIWNKPKFVRRSGYVITLDKIAGRDEALARRLLKDGGMKGQTAEWGDLNIVGAGFKAADVWTKDLTGGHLHERYRFLPVDTRYFKQLEPEILALFDDLDDALDGWLIRSENYQALNTILPKFRERVKCIYIDPPYNTEKDSFSYVDSFNRSAWATMLDNRLQVAANFLERSGAVYTHVDFHETATTRFIMDEIFGSDSFTNEIIWRVGWVSGFKGEGDKFVRNHETIWFYKMSEQSDFNKESIRIPFKTFLLSEEDVTALKKLQSRLGITAEKTQLVMKDGNGRIHKIESGKEPREGHYPVEDVWNANEYEDINSIMIMSFAKEKVGDFLTQKPEKLLKRILEASSQEEELILDYHGGTGTTAASAHKCRRRWISIEQAEGIYAKSLVRMKEVVAGRGHREPCGISKDVNWQGGGFFKYYELEQYEETLLRAKYEDSTFFDNPYEDPFQSYVFLRDVKLLDALEVDAEQGRVKVDLARLYPDVDAAETLSNLLGKRVKRLTPGAVEFADGETLDLNNLEFKTVKPLIWW